ncbi:MAG: hypothetical protein GWM98_11685 [Nitrospinaceae bacterium]|nr:hypothetical protein [Nitrospinaceae bacterium]NIR55045.1 hypothetical protein [Nitrospinaceae bacterium]NIS85444.1 hypothetical protein [Nitrospinaceae bacterium]NIT82283.1 hypothetical protein [Nitrospinaceae bacterium]NIU44514.1 hypothetical protein [Nitrospinaceae bacterium]
MKRPEVGIEWGTADVNDAAIQKLIDEVAALHRKKSADYTGGGDADPFANYKAVAEVGIEPWLYVFGRTVEKFGRAKTWTRAGKFECPDTFREELIDLALLLLIIVALLDETEAACSTK